MLGTTRSRRFDVVAVRSAVCRSPLPSLRVRSACPGRRDAHLPAGRSRAARHHRRLRRPRLVLARTSPSGALLVDLAGDAPPSLGLPDPDGPGLAGWLRGGRRRARRRPGPARARASGRGWRSCRAADGPLGPTRRAEALAALLAADPRPVVVDCGVARDDAGAAAPSPLARADRTRCSSRGPATSRSGGRWPRRSGRRASCSSTRPGGRCGRGDVEDVLGVPVRGRGRRRPPRSPAPSTPALLAVPRCPQALERALRRACRLTSAAPWPGVCVDDVHRAVRRRRRAPSRPTGRAPGPRRGAARRRRPTLDAVVAGCWPAAAGLGPLEPLLADPAVTEVMVNGPGAVWVERDGRLVPHDVRPRPRRRSSTSSSGRRPARAARRPPRRRWSTPGCPTAPGSTRSCRRWRSTVPASPSGASGRGRAARRRVRRPAVAALLHRRGARAPANIVVSRGHRRGQDHAAQRAGRRDPRGRAHRHRRGRGRAAAAGRATSCGSRPGRANAEGVGEVPHPRPGAQRAAHAPRPHRRGRGAAAPRRSTCCRR